MVARYKTIFTASASLVALAIVPCASAQAQDAPATNSDVLRAEVDGKAPIIVTGTRIVSRDLESANPVASLTADQIAQSGDTNLVDLLADTPALLGSVTSIRTAGPRVRPGGAGVNLLNLRNLGDERTLVLVNSRRHVASLPGSAAVDINTIPLALIDRVDVLTGGVSAIYGADGVSGVVNFVLKRDFEGIEARGQNGISSRGDAQEYFASLTAGSNFAGGAGNVAVSYEYRRTARVRGDARRTGQPGSYSALAQNLADLPDDPNVPDRIPYNDLRFATLSPLGAVDINFDGFPEFTGTGKPYDVGLFLPNSGGLSQGGDGTAVAGFSGDLQPEVETHNVNLLFSHELSPAARVFAEGKYVSTQAYTEGQPPFDGGSLLYGDNAYLPDAIRSAMLPFTPGVLVFRTHSDFGRKSQRSERDTWRLVLGLDGEISDHARYEVAYTYGRTKNRFVLEDERIADRYFAALDAVRAPDGSITCRSNLIPQAAMFDLNLRGMPVSTYTPGPQSGCVPINILGQNVANDDALAFFQMDLVNRVKLTQHVVTATVSGDFGAQFELPGGPVSFVLGGEYREEKSNFEPDQILLDGLALDVVGVSRERGAFDVWEAFAELQAPVLRDVPGAHLLQFGAALRLSDYSTVGGTTTWKVDGTYAPVRDLRLRGTYSHSVRAPNISELFAGQIGVPSFILDPCDIVTVASGTQFRAANCAALLSGFGIDPATFNPSSNPATAAGVGGITSGNPDIKEETAKTWTAGVVVTPSFAPALTASFDWYDIKLKNAINTPTAQELVDLCVDQPSLENAFCPSVSRNPATGYVNGFVLMPANVSRFRTSGAEFSINYRVKPAGDWGMLNLNLAGGYLDQLSFVASPGAAPTVETREVFAPKWSGNFDLSWTKGNVTANYGVSYFSKTRRFSVAELEANPDISDPRYFYFREKWEHDVRLAVRAYEDRVTFYGGVNNLFDAGPAIGETIYPVSFRGRFFYVGIQAEL